MEKDQRAQLIDILHRRIEICKQAIGQLDKSSSLNYLEEIYKWETRLSNSINELNDITEPTVEDLEVKILAALSRVVNSPTLVSQETQGDSDVKKSAS